MIINIKMLIIFYVNVKSTIHV